MPEAPEIISGFWWTHREMSILPGIKQKPVSYAEPGISREAQAEIKKILWNERMKAEAKRDAEKMKE